MTLPRSTLATLRFTPGFRPGLPPPEGPDDLLDGLHRAVAAPPRVDAAQDRRFWAEMEEVRQAQRAARRMEGPREAARAERRDLRRQVQAALLTQTVRAATSPYGLGERMARFWANHFSVSARGIPHASRLPSYEDMAIRPHMTGRFGDMLKAVVGHPAMLVYLDQQRSLGPNSPAGRRTGRGLNENLAREVLELHTLGVSGPYGQQDVQALAALLTGFALRKGEPVYRRNRAEPGRFDLLGERYQGGRRAGAEKALEALAVHPATARHVSWKLARHFVADDPPEELVEALAETWRATGGDLGQVTERLVTHPASWGPLGAKARQPQELVVAALRAAGADARSMARGRPLGPQLSLRAMKDMGQALEDAPGPDGWPEEAEQWITPGALANRLDWAARMGAALARTHDPRDYAQEALREALTEETAWAVSAAAEKREGFAILLASPDFGRR